jgi:hypothetical protein
MWFAAAANVANRDVETGSTAMHASGQPQPHSCHTQSTAVTVLLPGGRVRLTEGVFKAYVCPHVHLNFKVTYLA